jgi:hypothetical protein
MIVAVGIAVLVGVDGITEGTVVTAWVEVGAVVEGMTVAFTEDATQETRGMAASTITESIF